MIRDMTHVCHDKRDMTHVCHDNTGEVSSRFFTSPCVETCGGMLCDDVGLGKSVQMLGLVLARPAPPDFAVQELPTHTIEVVPIKGTLIVAPAALLPQWEGEIRKHTKPGALRTCTYLGVGSGRKKAAVAAAAVPAGGVGGSVRGGGSGESAAGVDDYEPRITRRSARTDQVTRPQFEVLSRTQRHLFEGIGTSRGEDDVDDGEVEVEKCDIILCSFETLRDELRKTQRLHAGMDLPLGTLGFWRIILDEAQLVSQSTSRAALVCSELWRRHAWVATGTPINAKADELHGLVAFLGTAPFKEEFHFNQLLLRPYREREQTALYKMRTLLRALCLRRSKLDPGISAQIAIPPLTWETRLLTFSDPERAIYTCAAQQLRRSHLALSRASASRTNSIEATRRRARLLGQLNGDLTRCV
jgi:E3 ubiquitin-protein ligase SHPRH